MPSTIPVATTRFCPSLIRRWIYCSNPEQFVGTLPITMFLYLCGPFTVECFGKGAGRRRRARKIPLKCRRTRFAFARLTVALGAILRLREGEGGGGLGGPGDPGGERHRDGEERGRRVDGRSRRDHRPRPPSTRNCRRITSAVASPLPFTQFHQNAP